MKTRRRSIALCSALALVLSVFTGCGGTQAPDTKTSQASNPATESTAATTEAVANENEPAAEKKNLRIGMIVPTMSAQFWDNCVNFAKKGAAELGCELVVFNADNKADQINKSIEDAIASGIDGLIFVPYWSAGRKAVTECKMANIPILTIDCFIDDIDTQTDEFPNYIAFVGPNDEDAGYKMAQALFEKTELAADGKKYVGVIQGTPGTTVAINREKGFDKALAENPNVEVVGRVNGNFVRDESQTAMEDLYQANPNMKGVWCANGGTATGAITAIKNAGKIPGKDIMVVAMDLNPENVDAVRNGELLYDIGGHWLQGGFALVILYDYLNDHKISKEDSNIVLNLLPVTSETVAQFDKDYPGGIPNFDFKQASKVYNPEAKPFFEMKYSSE